MEMLLDYIEASLSPDLYRLVVSYFHGPLACSSSDFDDSCLIYIEEQVTYWIQLFRKVVFISTLNADFRVFKSSIIVKEDEILLDRTAVSTKDMQYNLEILTKTSVRLLARGIQVPIDSFTYNHLDWLIASLEVRRLEPQLYKSDKGSTDPDIILFQKYLNPSIYLTSITNVIRESGQITLSMNIRWLLGDELINFRDVNGKIIPELSMLKWDFLSSYQTKSTQVETTINFFE